MCRSDSIPLPPSNRDYALINSLNAKSRNRNDATRQLPRRWTNADHRERRRMASMFSCRKVIRTNPTSSSAAWRSTWSRPAASFLMHCRSPLVLPAYRISVRVPKDTDFGQLPVGILVTSAILASRPRSAFVSIMPGGNCCSRGDLVPLISAVALPSSRIRTL